MSAGAGTYIQLLKAVTVASMEALAMEKRVAVLRGVFNTLMRLCDFFSVFVHPHFVQARDRAGTKTEKSRGTHVHACNAR
jgi:hypothetical protein